MALKSRLRRYFRANTVGDIAYDVVSNVLIVLLVILVFYPLYFVVIASFSDPTYVNSGEPLLWIKGFNTLGYEKVFENKDIWIGYGNTILYTVCGTIFGTFCVLLAGFVFSRKNLPGKNVFMLLFVFTMYFSGGLIPTFTIVKSIGLLDSRLLMIVMGSVSAYNIIVVKSFMESSIPDELADAAMIDGCGIGRFFWLIVVPLSKAIIAVIVLYIAVAHWNSYFNAMVYLQDPNKQPLQMILRELLLVANNYQSMAGTEIDPEVLQRLQESAMLIKYSVIVVATAPILCVYPFVQKYFVKGVMIGSVKG